MILFIYCNVSDMMHVRHSIVASIPACHAGDQGSIPCHGGFSWHGAVVTHFTCNEKIPSSILGVSFVSGKADHPPKGDPFSFQTYELFPTLDNCHRNHCCKPEISTPTAPFCAINRLPLHWLCSDFSNERRTLCWAQSSWWPHCVPMHFGIISLRSCLIIFLGPITYSDFGPKIIWGCTRIAVVGGGHPW